MRKRKRPKEEETADCSTTASNIVAEGGMGYTLNDTNAVNRLMDTKGLYFNDIIHMGAEMAFLNFWGHSQVDDANSYTSRRSGVIGRSASSSITYSLTPQTSIPNEGGPQDESQIRLENILLLLALIGLILSLKVLFG